MKRERNGKTQQEMAAQFRATMRAMVRMNPAVIERARRHYRNDPARLAKFEAQLTIIESQTNNAR